MRTAIVVFVAFLQMNSLDTYSLKANDGPSELTLVDKELKIFGKEIRFRVPVGFEVVPEDEDELARIQLAQKIEAAIDSIKSLKENRQDRALIKTAETELKKLRAQKVASDKNELAKNKANLERLSKTDPQKHQELVTLVKNIEEANSNLLTLRKSRADPSKIAKAQLTIVTAEEEKSLFDERQQLIEYKERTGQATARLKALETAVFQDAVITFANLSEDKTLDFKVRIKTFTAEHYTEVYRKLVSINEIRSKIQGQPRISRPFSSQFEGLAKDEVPWRASSFTIPIDGYGSGQLFRARTITVEKSKYVMIELEKKVIFLDSKPPEERHVVANAFQNQVEKILDSLQVK